MPLASPSQEKEQVSSSCGSCCCYYYFSSCSGTCMCVCVDVSLCLEREREKKSREREREKREKRKEKRKRQQQSSVVTEDEASVCIFSIYIYPFIYPFIYMNTQLPLLLVNKLQCNLACIGKWLTLFSSVSLFLFSFCLYFVTVSETELKWRRNKVTTASPASMKKRMPGHSVGVVETR